MAAALRAHGLKLGDRVAGMHTWSYWSRLISTFSQSNYN
jgi:hypothetical protein